jgi:hypothetical protein
VGFVEEMRRDGSGGPGIQVDAEVETFGALEELDRCGNGELVESKGAF